MSKEALAKVVQRAISDGAFRRQLSTDPSSALRGFDLSSDETAAIRSGDSGRLSALGIDVRMSKAFTLGDDGAGDALRKVVSNDLGASYTGAATTGGFGTAGSGALIDGDGTDLNAALINDNAPTGEGVVTAGDTQNAIGASIGGDGPSFESSLTPGDSMSEGVVVVDHGGVSGASTPGEASDGPAIQD